MSYIGNTPTNQNFVAGSDQFNGTGSQTVFTLSRNVNTVNDIQVVVSNVPQDPFTAYSVSGNTLTFTSAPPSGTGNIYVVYRATNVQTFVPSPGATVGGSFGIQGNLNFYGTGNRITGDFSNATIANRVMFQNSVTNATTNIQALPNGTSVVSGLVAFANSDPTNTSFAGFQSVGTEVRVSGGITGTGSYPYMTFYTGGSERMRIDTSGNVGIGTSSPAGRLHARWDAGAGDGYTGKFVFSTTDQALFVKTYWESGAGQHTTLEASNLANSTLTDLRLNGSTLQFLTGSSERARIDSTGRFVVGTSSSAGWLGRISSESDSNGAAYPLAVNNTASGTGSSICIDIYRSATRTGSINNTNTTTSYGTSSDYRLKENVQPMQGALARVAALKPVTYKWKIDGSDGEGFIAHELAEVCPQAVTGEKDAVNEDGSIKPQGIDTSFLVATLTAAIKEQQQMIETLQAKVAALEAK